MQEKTQTLMDKVVSFIKKYCWAFAIGAAILAIVFTLLPVVNYEIREATYNISTGKRTLKNDYVYGFNVIQYFTTSFKYNFTMYVTLGLVVVGIGFVVGSIFKKDLMTAASLFFLLAMCMFILSKEFFKANGEEAIVKYAKIHGIEYDLANETFSVTLHDVSLSWGSALGIAFTNIAFAFTMANTEKHTIKQIVEEGVLIAVAFVLNFIKIPLGPSGSINFQMLPLMIIALRHGPQHGFIAGGIVYGLLTCLTDGYGLVTYPFDYLIGFGSVAVMGFFRTLVFGKNQESYNFKGLLFIFVSGSLSTLVRFVGSTVSSIVVYNYDLVSALAYNALYIPLSGLAAIIVLMIMYGPLLKVNKRFPVNEESKEKEAAAN